MYGRGCGRCGGRGHAKGFANAGEAEGVAADGEGLCVHRKFGVGGSAASILSVSDLSLESSNKYMPWAWEFPTMLLRGPPQVEKKSCAVGALKAMRAPFSAMVLRKGAAVPAFDLVVTSKDHDPSDDAGLITSRAGSAPVFAPPPAKPQVRPRLLICLSQGTHMKLACQLLPLSSNFCFWRALFGLRCCLQWHLVRRPSFFFLSAPHFEDSK